MRALSIRQPWAWAILHAGKDVENRGWRTSYRGRLVIHAAKTIDRDALDRLAHLTGLGWTPLSPFVTGCLLGTVELLGCSRHAFSGWAEPGAWHWQLSCPRPLAEPIPWPGARGLFTVPDDVIAAVTA